LSVAVQGHCARTRRRRARQRGRDGLRFYRLLIDDATMETVLDALVRVGRLTEAAALHHPTVEAALVQVIADMGARWLR